MTTATTTTTTITDTATVTATAATTATTATTTVLLLLLLLLLLLYYRCCSYLLYYNSYNGHYHFCTRTLVFLWARSACEPSFPVAARSSPGRLSANGWCTRWRTSPMAGDNYRQRLVEWKAFTANGWCLFRRPCPCPCPCRFDLVGACGR